MVIGTVREIKNNEFRVGLTPGGAHSLAAQGHRVLIEAGAGSGSGFEDAEYARAGAELVDGAGEVYARADMVIKVKEPLRAEYGLLREGGVLFTYLHLAADAQLAEVLLEKGITGIAYETVRLASGALPLLAPMSAVAGRMSAMIGANLLFKNNGGAGVLAGGAPGVLPAEVVIIGGGVVGSNAARMAVGLGASVTMLDISAEKLRALDDMFQGRVKTLSYSAYNAAQAVKNADLLIGAVLVPGASAPKVVSEEMVRSMRKGSVIIDVAIDQGGSIATIDRVTTHDNPTYLKYGVLHYSVANMPGAVPRTSTLALEAAVLPYASRLAGTGVSRALREDSALAHGVATHRGVMTCESTAISLGKEFVPLDRAV